MKRRPVYYQNPRVVNVFCCNRWKYWLYTQSLSHWNTDSAHPKWCLRFYKQQRIKHLQFDYHLFRLIGAHYSKQKTEFLLSVLDVEHQKITISTTSKIETLLTCFRITCCNNKIHLYYYYYFTQHIARKEAKANMFCK